MAQLQARDRAALADRRGQRRHDVGRVVAPHPRQALLHPAAGRDRAEAHHHGGGAAAAGAEVGDRVGVGRPLRRSRSRSSCPRAGPGCAASAVPSDSGDRSGGYTGGRVLPNDRLIYDDGPSDPDTRCGGVQMTERIGLLRGKGFELGPLRHALPVRGSAAWCALLADQAADRGDATWLVFDGADELSFREAHELTNRVAHALIATVGAGAHVGLFLRNQREFMPVFYGAMAAGGAAVPLNADARGPLLEYVIDRSDARALISRADLLDRLAELRLAGRRRAGAGRRRGATCRRSAAGVPVERFEDWLEGRPLRPARPVPRGRRGRADPVHLGHDRPLEGGRLPAPVPLPLLGDARPTRSATRATTSSPRRCRSSTWRRCTSSPTRRCTPAAPRTSRAASRPRPTGSRWPRTGPPLAILLGPMAAIILKQSARGPGAPREHDVLRAAAARQGGVRAAASA